MNKKKLMVWGLFIISTVAVLYLITRSSTGLIAFGFLLGAAYYKITLYLGMIKNTPQKTEVSI